MKTYLKLLQKALKEGMLKHSRTGIDTLSFFGYQMRFDLTEGFPLVTTKKIHFKSVVHELLWFLKGDTNIKYLQDNGVRIWNEWADESGNLGPIYGKQWRNWNVSDNGTFDQINNVIENIKHDPDSRRLIVSAWNVSDLPNMALMPCHTLFQFYVLGNKLSCQLYQRSADIFLGVPFNIASYSLLTIIIAKITGLEVGDFVHTLGDAHLYTDHIEQAKKQLSRIPLPLPFLKIEGDFDSIDDIKYDNIKLVNYNSHSAIKAKVSI